MGLYEVPLSMSGFMMGTVLANFHMCGIMLVLRAVFNMLVCQDPVSCNFYLFYCLLNLSCGGVISLVCYVFLC